MGLDALVGLRHRRRVSLQPRVDLRAREHVHRQRAGVDDEIGEEAREPSHVGGRARGAHARIDHPAAFKLSLRRRGLQFAIRAAVVTFP